MINRKICILLFVIAYFSVFASVVSSKELSAEEHSYIEVEILPDGSYYISFNVDGAGDSEASREEIEAFRVSMNNRVDGQITSTEQRVQSVIDNILYFTEVNPRNFRIEPVGEPGISEQDGEVRLYRFCVNFGPIAKTTVCPVTSFVVDELDLLAALNEADIAFEIVDGSDNDTLSMGGGERFFFERNEVLTFEDGDWSDPDEYAEYLESMLRLLCGEQLEYCDEWGVSDRYVESTGGYEVYGYYINYVDNTSDMNFKPGAFDRPLNSDGPPGDHIEI